MPIQVNWLNTVDVRGESCQIVTEVVDGACGEVERVADGGVGQSLRS